MLPILLEINYKLREPTQTKVCLTKLLFPWKPHDTVERSCQIQQGITVFKLFYVQVLKHLNGKDLGCHSLSTALERSEGWPGSWCVFSNLSCYRAALQCPFTAIFEKQKATCWVWFKVKVHNSEQHHCWNSSESWHSKQAKAEQHPAVSVAGLGGQKHSTTWCHHSQLLWNTKFSRNQVSQRPAEATWKSGWWVASRLCRKRYPPVPDETLAGSLTTSMEKTKEKESKTAWHTLKTWRLLTKTEHADTAILEPAVDLRVSLKCLQN